MSSKTLYEQLPSVLEKLVPAIKSRVNTYHTIFDLPLTAVLWEEVLHKSFGDVGITTDWKPILSHAIGEDMRLNGIDSSRISCKSGTITLNNELSKKCVRFSGSRTSTFPLIEEKIAHLCGNHDDVYFLLTKLPPKMFNKQYTLLVFASTVCKIDKLTWSPSGKSWAGVGDFKATIGPQTISGQLWTTLPLDMIEYKFDIDC